MKKILLILAPAMVLILANHAISASGGHESNHSGDASSQPFNQEYMKAMDAMHNTMMEGIMDSDPDKAFVKGMLPHHEAAVAMARIQLKYGKDAELIKLARIIIEQQDREIDFMKEWLKTNDANQSAQPAGKSANPATNNR